MPTIFDGPVLGVGHFRYEGDPFVFAGQLYQHLQREGIPTNPPEQHGIEVLIEMPIFYNLAFWRATLRYLAIVHCDNYDGRFNYEMFFKKGFIWPFHKCLGRSDYNKAKEQVLCYLSMANVPHKET